MADVCEETSDSCSDITSGDNSSFYAKSHGSSGKAKITQWEIEFIFETVCEREFCEKDKASLETVIWAGKACQKITQLVKTSLHENRDVARSG